MNLDIHTAVQTALIFAGLAGLISFILGVRAIQAGNKLLFFRKRRGLISRGWRLIFLAAVMVLIAVSMNFVAEPVIYKVFPPSPTVTDTPTITLTPTVSLTPTITLTPSITPTLSITPTPMMPPEIAAQFTSVITPNAKAVFSPLQFSQKLDKNRQAENAGKTFKNPVGKLFGAFSYDQLNEGTQWTALWYRLEDKKLICYESLPWNGGSGGYGYTECQPAPSEWKPGEYEVQIFLGTSWRLSGRFAVEGDSPAPVGTPSPQSATTQPAGRLTITPAPITITPKP